MNKREKRDQNYWSVGKLIFVCFGVLACQLIVLVLLDYFHASIGKTFKHYFVGEIWFTAIASFIAAVPGVLCGVFALKQTDRLHELESRYHRPALILKEIVLNVLSYGSESEKIFIDRKGAAAKRIINIAKADKLNEKGNLAKLILLNIEFVLKNDVVITDMQVYKVLFKINKKEYILELEKKDSRTLKELGPSLTISYKEGEVIYKLWEFLYPFKIKKEQDVIEFFKELDIFSFKDRYRNPNYHRIELEVWIETKHQYTKKKIPICLRCNMQNDFQLEESFGFVAHTTSDGVILYDN